LLAEMAEENLLSRIREIYRTGGGEKDTSFSKFVRGKKRKGKPQKCCFMERKKGGKKTEWCALYERGVIVNSIGGGEPMALNLVSEAGERESEVAWRIRGNEGGGVRAEFSSEGSFIFYARIRWEGGLVQGLLGLRGAWGRLAPATCVGRNEKGKGVKREGGRGSFCLSCHRAGEEVEGKNL